MAIPGASSVVSPIVSLGVLAVGARRALVPIAADFVTLLVISVIKPAKTWRELYLYHAIVILPAMGAVYAMYGLPELNASTVIMGCLYLAYKIGLFWLLSLAARKPGK